MGGRAAEEIFFGNDEITTGCGSDLRQATYTAYRMLLLSGMGKELLSAELDDISDLKRADLENEIREYLGVCLTDLV
jgi:ATP-dependent Zn protease